MLWQHLTPGEGPVPIVQEAGWASGPVWTGVENHAPPGFDPQTVQSVGSRYTDYTTRPTIYICVCVCVYIYIYKTVFFFPPYFVMTSYFYSTTRG